jgi:hypothetical protein
VRSLWGLIVSAATLTLITACGAPEKDPVVGAASAATCSDPVNDEDGHCAFELKDSHRRTGVPRIGENEALDEAAVAVHLRVHDAGAGELSATEADAAKVRQALAAGDYAEVTVRLARDSDPTVPGALLYAVRVGDVCVLGDVTPPPDERWHEWYAGLLPDGRCLDA